MPAALDVNREAVRVLVVAVGVREAARQVGLPESTVKSWCTRGKWLQPVVQPPTVLVASNASNAADSLANTLADENNRTKLGFSRAAVKVAEKAGTWQPGQILNKSRELRDVATIAGKVHGWDESKGGGGRVMINIGILNE